MSTDLHRECWLMLPWVVTGRISATDKQRIERHLLECAECRAELEAQRSLCEQIRRDESVMLAPQSSFQRLMERIDTGEPPRVEDMTIDMPAASASSPAAASNPKRVPRWFAIAAAVQAIAIGGLLMLVWQMRTAEMSAPRFTTQSSVAAPTPSGVVLRVVFRPEMTNAELQDLLHGVGAHVVAGPTEAGVYSLQLADGTPGQEVGDALAKVRASPNVVFAEHVSAEPAQ
jgi:anti-sigma factor RsiW